MKKKTITHQVYTDGSCTKNPGGHGSYCVIFIENNQVSYELHQAFYETTSPRMEIMGILAALRFIDKEDYMKYNYDFFSDSEYVVKTINLWMNSWARIGWNRCEKKNIDLWHEIYNLWDRKRFSIKWIKGHNVNQWNETADMFCTQTIEEAMRGELPWSQDKYYNKPFIVDEENMKKIPQRKPRPKQSLEEIQAYLRAQVGYKEPVSK